LKSEAILHDHSSQCLNCGTAVSANFCAECGQETRLHMPSAGEFLHEFVGHYVALEGKLWKSLGLLLFRPGRLTLEYLQGKRVRYVLPLRLYLTFSLIFFALFKAGGVNVAKMDPADSKPPAAVHAQDKRTARGEDKLVAERQARHASDEADKQVANEEDRSGDTDKVRLADKLRNAVAKISPKLVEHVDKFDGLSPEQQEHQLKAAFFGYVPYAVFALMPVFALLLKLLYLGSGRRYGEHVLFALHTNAFAFMTLSLLMVVPGIPFLRPALGLWLVFYLPTAMRRVYGGSRLVTFLRWTVLMLLHLLCIVLAIVGAFALAILA
jgi:hypothetical protein